MLYLSDKKSQDFHLDFFSTKGGTRTLTPLKATDFESVVSTNSTTLAYFLASSKIEF